MQIFWWYRRIAAKMGRGPGAPYTPPQVNFHKKEEKKDTTGMENGGAFELEERKGPLESPEMPDPTVSSDGESEGEEQERERAIRVLHVLGKEVRNLTELYAQLHPSMTDLVSPQRVLQFFLENEEGMTEEQREQADYVVLALAEGLGYRGEDCNMEDLSLGREEEGDGEGGEEDDPQEGDLEKQGQEGKKGVFTRRLYVGIMVVASAIYVVAMGIIQIIYHVYG